MNVKRRAFLEQLTISFGSILFWPGCSGYHFSWRFFNEKEARIVTAFAEQIIPEDQDAGATTANVINFIDKQLVGPYIRFQEVYRKGILAIEESTRKMFQKSFDELDWQVQNDFMIRMESGDLPIETWDKTEQRSFFSMLIDHSMQGFYGSPRHGGNKNSESYRMLKLDYPYVLGQNRYKQSVYKVR